MNPTRWILSVFVLAGTLPVRAQETVVTLSQCQAWALQNSESRRISRESISQSESRARAALGGILPTVQWTWDRTWQDTSGLPVFNDPSGFSNSFALKRQDVSKFTVDQALFGGFREFTARAGFLKERDRDALRLDHQSLEIFKSVMASFYDVRATETLRDNVAEALALADRRTAELKSRYRLGKARESEMFSAEAQAASLRAQWIHLGGQTRWSRENLSYVTGRDIASAPLADDETLSDRPAPLETFTGQLD
ncbi:MAG TPA: TolC family protein, partial [Elusimicrobiota bacterium]|nr:TolC family protein [Elusimicrobiota bacterium]